MQNESRSSNWFQLDFTFDKTKRKTFEQKNDENDERCMLNSTQTHSENESEGTSDSEIERERLENKNGIRCQHCDGTST